MTLLLKFSVAVHNLILETTYVYIVSIIYGKMNQNLIQLLFMFNLISLPHISIIIMSNVATLTLYIHINT